MVPILLYKTILATGVSIILAFLFGLSLVDSFLSWKTLCWAILFAQRIVSLIDGPMKNVPFVTNWSLGKDPVTVAKELVPVLTAVFSWSASIVIPLDWERSWQKWPIPNLLGAELGFLAGLVLQTIVLGMISLSKKKTH